MVRGPLWCLGSIGLNQVSPPRAAHVARERGSQMAVQPSRVRAQITDVERDLEPGDYIVAEVTGQVGPVPRWEHLVICAACALAAFDVFLFIALLVDNKPIQSALIWAVLTPVQVASALAARRKPTCMVVTRRRVYLMPLGKRRRDRRAAILRTPVGCTRISHERRGRFRSVVRIEGPAFPLRGLQFLVAGDRRANLDSTLAAIRSGADAATYSSGVFIPASASIDFPAAGTSATLPWPQTRP
jgi:hypothetical protein